MKKSVIIAGELCEFKRIKKIDERRVRDTRRSVPEVIVLVYRATSRMVLEPGTDTPFVEATEALETRHGHANFEVLEADGTLGRVYTVFF